LEILFCAGLKKGDSLMNTIVTIPWLPFHASTWGCFSRTYLSYYRPPLMAIALPIPSPSDWPRLLLSLTFYLYKYPSSLIPVIILVHMTYEDGTDGVPKRWHIKFRCQGIPQKKVYNIIINIIIINALVIQPIYI